MTPVVGTTLAGRYLLRARIGVGGSGEVWRALDSMLDREVAVKLVGADIEPGRLRREARAAARVSHSNVVAVFDAGEVDGRAFLVMELVHGTDLATLVRHGGALPEELVGVVATDLASGLAAVHDAGFVHRDVTPGNLLVTTTGHVKLADLGTARVVDGDGVDQVTMTGLVVGTVDYLAPEQLGDTEPTPATDVYAAGLVLRTCATALRPFGGGTVPERTARRLTEDPAPLPDVEGWLAVVVATACRRDPADRPADGAALLRLLGDTVPHDPGDHRAALAERCAAAASGRPPTHGGTSDDPTATRQRTTRLDLTTTATTAIPTAALDRSTDRDSAARGRGREDATGPGQGREHTTDAGRGRDDPTADHGRGQEDDATGADHGREHATDAGRGRRDATVDGRAAPAPPGRRPPRRRSRLGPVLVAMVAIAVVVGVVSGSTDSGGDGDGGDGGDPAEGGGAAAPYAIADATDFDPLGGDGEHPEEVPDALDGDPATAWTTQQYTTASLGGLKEGVGLLLDLGEQRDVGSVVVDLGVDGVDLEVHVAEDRPDGAPPSSTLFGAASDAAGTVSIGDDPVSGRWVTLWFTRLGDANGFQAAVREVTVRP